MSIENSFSSQGMKHLLTWRNPSDTANKLAESQCTSVLKTIGKRLVTGVALIGLIALAAIETVVYGALALLSLALYRWNEERYEGLVENLKSSSFTILWGFGATCYNLFSEEVAANENWARVWGKNTTGLPFTRTYNMPS